jgi:hypothetical protein
VIDEQERVPVREDALDVADVEHLGRLYFFFVAAAAGAEPPSAPSPAL